MNIKRLAGLTVGVIILMMLFLFVSCSSTQMDAYNQSLGSVKESPEVSRLFKTYQYHPEYKYYYAGSKNDPDAVVGIHSDYLLEETSGRSFMAVRWTEFETTQKNLEIMINGIETHAGPMVLLSLMMKERR